MSTPAVAIFESDRAAPCSERALVLGTQGIAADVLHADGRYVLVVPASHADGALAQLDTWQRENVDWPPRHAPPRYEYLDAWPGVLIYLFLMCLMAGAKIADPGGFDWFSAGKLNAGLVRSGEWWRAVTALTLHLDIAHLASNLVFGGAFGYFVGRYFGSGIAWLAILVAGAAGNVLNSFLQPATHTAVGASTAIFAALGILAAFAWKRKLYPQDRWAYRLGPIIAGVALLAYTGTGGERTDVSAHVTGFASGFAVGVALALAAVRLPRSGRAQWLAGGVALALLGVCWTLALPGPL